MEVQGVVESMKRDGTAIKVGGEWYSAYQGRGLAGVQWKDEVKFEYEQRGRFKNIKGTVSVLSTSGVKSALGLDKMGTKGTKPYGYSNLGVELGHAANLAMKVVDHDSGIPLDLDAWEKATHDIYARMKKIRARYEGDPAASSLQKTEEQLKTIPPDLEEEDIF